MWIFGCKTERKIMASVTWTHERRPKFDQNRDSLRYILVHRGETLFQPGTFTTYKPFPSFCVYAHVAITRATRFAADPIAVFDGPFVIIIQGRKPRSLLSYHWFHTVVSLTNLLLTLFITIYFLKVIFHDIYLTGNCVISFLHLVRK